MQTCEKCGDKVPEDEIYEFGGQKLCEDCYLEKRAKPVTCDPWAVYSAKNTSGQSAELTEIQQKIMDLLKGKSSLPGPEICRLLGISEDQFQTNFATLRHMELARGFRKDGEVHFTLFGNP